VQGSAPQALALDNSAARFRLRRTGPGSGDKGVKGGADWFYFWHTAQTTKHPAECIFVHMGHGDNEAARPLRQAGMRDWDFMRLWGWYRIFSLCITQY
jgi:hypothetical protein